MAAPRNEKGDRPGDDTVAESGTIGSATSVTVSPRDSLAPWKFKLMMPLLFVQGLAYGYDVGNVANIQAPIYLAMGSDIQLLPWIGLAFSTGNVAVIPLVRKLTGLFDLRWIYAIGFLLFAIGAAISGSANTMPVVIVGRVLTGVGLATTYQT